MNVVQQLATLFAASYPLVYIYSHEEERVLETLYGVGQMKGLDMQLLTWSATEGLVDWKEGSAIQGVTNDYIGAPLARRR